MDLVVSAVMQKNVVAASTSMTLEELGSLLDRNRFSGLPVVDDGVLVGVVAESDLVASLYATHDVAAETMSDGELRCMMDNSLGNVALKISVGDIMTRDVITVTPKDYLRDAAALMYRNCVHRVFVVENEKLVGVLSSFDFVRLYARNRIKAGSIPNQQAHLEHSQECMKAVNAAWRKAGKPKPDDQDGWARVAQLQDLVSL